MCGRLRINKTIVRPRQVIPSNQNTTGIPMVWGAPVGAADQTPFARIETLVEKWLSRKNMGWEVGTLMVDDLAEFDSKRELRWRQSPAGIKVLIRNVGGKYWSVVIVTRASTAEELKKYDHNRHPVLVEESSLLPKVS